MEHTISVPLSLVPLTHYYFVVLCVKRLAEDFLLETEVGFQIQDFEKRKMMFEYLSHRHKLAGIVHPSPCHILWEELKPGSQVQGSICKQI